MDDMAGCQLLDDLFAWAAQQPSGNQTSVLCNLVTNTSAFQGGDKNLVSYAEGRLLYQPDGAMFTTGGQSLRQYFSDQRYMADPQSLTNYPFSSARIDPLDFEIRSVSGSYHTSISSTMWGFTFNFDLQCLADLVYAEFTSGAIALVSLCQRQSEAPPR